MAVTQESIENAIAAIVRTRVQELLKVETAKAIASLEQTLQKELGGIALSVLKHYRVDTMGQDIVIRVQNDANFQRKT